MGKPGVCKELKVLRFYLRKVYGAFCVVALYILRGKEGSLSPASVQKVLYKAKVFHRKEF